MKKIKIKIDVNIPEIGSFQPTLGRVTGNLEQVNSSDRLPYCRAGIIRWMSPDLDEISFISFISPSSMLNNSLIIYLVSG